MFIPLVLLLGEALLLSPANAASPLAPGGIDLHTHLLMKDGMKVLIAGNYDEEPRSTFWNSRLSTKISFKNLEATGLDVVVVSLYAHPWVAYPLEKNLRKQVEALEEWVKKHPKWIIAASATEARDALKSGRKVFVLSMEGAEGVFDTPEQRQYWFQEKKLRIVTPLHLTPDSLGGPALMGSLGVLNAPWAWIVSLVSNEKDESGVHLNVDGLSAHGREVIDQLIAAGVWIDLAHSSDRAQKEIYPRMKVAGQPALYTHTMLRKYNRTERGVSEEQLGWVRDSGGMVGLIPADEMLAPASGTTVGLTCTEGFGALSAHWVAASIAAGDASVTLGTDGNAPLKGMSPACLNADSRKRIGDKGFYREDQLPEVFRALGQDSERLSAKVERFLAAWERVHPQLVP